MTSATAITTLKEMFADLDATLQSDPSRTTGVRCNFAFVVAGPNGGNWWIEASDGIGRVHDGVPAEAAATIQLQDDVMLRVGTGALSGAEAFMTGQLHVEGDQGKAVFLGQIFGQ